MKKLKDILTIITIKKLAEITGLSESHLTMVKNGKRPLTKGLINRIDKIKNEIISESEYFNLTIKYKDENLQK